MASGSTDVPPRGRALSAGVLALLFALAAAAPLARPAAEQLYRLESGAELRVPLERRQKTLDLGSVAAIVFEIRGERGGEDVEIALDSDGEKKSAGSIYGLLPLGSSVEWEQIGLAPKAFGDQPPARASALVFRFMRGKGVAFVRNVAVIPVVAGLESWDRVVAPLRPSAADGRRQLGGMEISYYRNSDGTGYWGSPSFPDVSPPPIPKVSLLPIPKVQKPAHYTPEKKFHMVADFDGETVNALRGAYGPYSREPSAVELRWDNSVRRGAFGRSLALAYRQGNTGYCGMWMHLYDDSKPADGRRYFNVTPFRYLSFWIRGARGGEDVDVRLADWSLQSREDSLQVARVSEILPGGITTEWREVLIPVDDKRLASLDLELLATIVLAFRQGEGTIFVDDIAFKVERDEQPPPRAPRPEPKTSTPAPPPGRATWVWNSWAPLRDRDERSALLEFTTAHRIGIVFLQMQYEIKDGVCVFKERDALRELIREAHSRGAKIYALDGDKLFALAPWHDDVLAEVRAVIEYNRSVAAEERFDGIHHDIEPYLLPGFFGPAQPKILRQYLDLLAGCRDLIRASGQTLPYGLDIPFWYENALAELEWRGRTKPPSHHIIDLVDYISIMDYRTAAVGADGTIAHALDEVDYAASVGKKVIIALETTPLPDESILRFRQDERPGASRSVDPTKIYALVDRAGDVAIAYLSRYHLSAPAAVSLPKNALKNKALYVNRGRTEVPAAKITFAGKNDRDLEAVVQQTLEYFRTSQSLAGIAIHHYASYRDLVKKGP
jgi:hypothetical protein